MSTHPAVGRLYEHLARLAKSIASPKRLEIIDLLCQAPKAVETLAEQAGITVGLASAHLKDLRSANLVTAERAGRKMIYRLASPEVASLLVAMRALAADRLLDLRDALGRLQGDSESWTRSDGPALSKMARRGLVTILDVRPEEEYEVRHLDCAANIPIGQLAKRLRELPKDRPVVAYCRGPYCRWSGEAVTLLRKAGFEAYHLDEGPSVWLARDIAGTNAD